MPGETDAPPQVAPALTLPWEHPQQAPDATQPTPGTPPPAQGQATPPSGVSAADISRLQGAQAPVDPNTTTQGHTDITSTMGTRTDTASTGEGSGGLGDDVGRIVDASKGVARGAERALKSGAADLMELGGKFDPTQSSASTEDINKLLDKIPEPKVETGAGEITSGISQFVTGMVGLGKLRELANVVTGLPKIAKSAIDSGLSGALAFKPYEDRLSNILEAHPSLSNPVSAFLAANPKDPEVVERFKAFLENAGLGAAGDGLFKIVSAFRTARPLAAAGKGEEAATVVEKAANDAANPAPVEPVAPAATPTTPIAPGGGAGEALTPEAHSQFVGKIFDMAQKGQLDYFGPVIGKDFNFGHFEQTDSKQVINEMSKMIPDSVRFTETRATTAALGKKFLTDPTTIAAKISEGAKSANEAAGLLHSAGLYTDWLGKSISDLARQRSMKMANGEDGAAEMAQMQTFAQKMSDVQQSYIAMKRSAGRTLGSLNLDKPAFKMDPQLADSLGLAQNPIQSFKMVAASQKGLGFKVLNEVHINSLLSGLTSIGTHTMGVINNSVVMPTEKYLLGSALTGGRDGIMGQAPGYIMGMWKGLFDSARMTGRALYNEAPILEQGGLVEHPPAITPENFNLSPTSVMGQVVSGTGKFTRMPTRLRMGLDEFTKQMNYRAYMTGQAMQEGAQKGLSGDALAEHIENTLENSFASDGKGTIPEAMDWAKQTTFTQPIQDGTVAATLQRALAQHPAGRLLIPFLKVPYNLMVSGAMDRTPLVNMLRQQYRDDFFGSNGAGPAALARGKMMTGLALVGGVSYLAAGGALTGSGPANREARTQLMQTGWQPYSVKMGDGSYMSYARAEPYATHLGIIADAVEIMSHLEDKDAGDVAMSIATSTAHSLMSKMYLQGLSGGIDAMSNPDQQLPRWLSKFGQGFIPGALNGVASTIGQGDPYMRETRSFVDALRAKIPGISEGLPPQRNLVGDPVINKYGVGNNGWNPLTVTNNLDEPWSKEIGRMNAPISELPWKIGNINLTPDQHEQWGRLIQQTDLEGNGTLKAKLNELVQSDDYKNKYTDSQDYQGSRAREIDHVVQKYREGTRELLLQDNPKLKDAVMQDKMQKIKALMTPGIQKPVQDGQ